MKKLKLVVLGLIVSLNSFGQTINDTPIKEINVDYVEIVGTSNFLGTKVSIDIDFGQKTNIWNGGDTKLLANDGSVIKLNSMIDALNFMCQNNYEFVTAYIVTVSNQNIYHYLLRKKK